MRELQRRWQGREACGSPSPSLPPPLLGCQWVEDPLIQEGQVGGVILLPFSTHQRLFGSPEDAENVSLALGFSFCCSQAHGSLSRCSRAVNATAKPDSSCAGWKGSEVLQCLPYARDSMQVDQTELCGFCFTRNYPAQHWFSNMTPKGRSVCRAWFSLDDYLRVSAHHHEISFRHLLPSPFIHSFIH